MEEIYTFIFHDHDWIAKLVSALIPLALLGRLIFIDIWNCYLLLYRLNRGTARGRWYRICGTLAVIALRDGTLFKSEKRTLFRRVRMRAEHELFRPRPVYHWPPRETQGGEGAPSGRWASWCGWLTHRHDVRRWEKEMALIYQDSGQFIILDSPAEANAQLADVKHYFQIIRSLRLTGEEAGVFLSPLKIKSGFITPLHLLTGLLATFDDTWDPILRTFNRDANDSHALGLGDFSRDVRQIQMFIYNCWLLWGPSIPLCRCEAWQGDYQLVQYGFGDENNSIEVVGQREDIQKFLGELMAEQTEAALARGNNGETPVTPRPFTGMAIPARIVGQLRLSGSLTGNSIATLDELPQAARDSWGREVNERPVMFVSQIFHTSAIERTARRDQLNHGKILSDRAALPSRYYSAYLWVGFVLLGEEEGQLKPLSWLHKGSPRPWQDFVPFFEHGNLADPESCLFGKRQLATKAVAALANLVRRWEPEETPLRFAFACAIDECGCGRELAYKAWNGGTTMRQLVRETLQEGAERGNDPAYRRMRDEDILTLTHFNGEADGHPYAACSLPRHIGQHYDTMDLPG